MIGLTSVEASQVFLIDLDEKNAITANEVMNRLEVVLDKIYSLQRLIEKTYLNLPWPNQVKSVLVFTHVVGGCGDIAACAKLIKVLKKSKPIWKSSGY